MATFYSTQRTNDRAVPPVPLAPVDKGKVKAVYFRYTAPASSMPAAGDTIELCKLPKGARVVESFLAWDAQASGATLSLGISGTVAKYMAAQTMTSAGVKAGPTLIAELVDTPEANDVTVIGTLATAGLAANGNIAGWLQYTID